MGVPSLLLVTLFVSACGSARYLNGPVLPALLERPAASITRHVVLVSIDGLRPDAIETFGAATLQKLTREGSYSLKASTILPSKTLPSHTSMLTGQPPESHGVRWNNVVSADRDLIETTTVFGVARRHGYTTAAFFSKPKFQPLQQAEALDYSQAPGGWWGSWSARRTLDDVERYLATAQPNLLFVHLADVDKAGHKSGWMGTAYGRAVGDVDVAVSRLLAVAERTFGAGNYTLIVTADHGGHQRDHGSNDLRDVTIPWIAWGRGARASAPLGEIRTIDTASTVLWLLGLEEPTEWPGTPVTTAFVAN